MRDYNTIESDLSTAEALAKQSLWACVNAEAALQKCHTPERAATLTIARATHRAAQAQVAPLAAEMSAWLKANPEG